VNDIPKRHNSHLTSGRLLAKNTVWNLIGFATPLLVAVFCIPVLIRDLGKGSFGVLTLAWALIGYASLFDLGLGRALTQLVARKLGAGEEREIPSLVWTSLLLMLLFGFLGTAVIYAISPWLVHRGLNVPVELQTETQTSFRWLGLSIPFVITTTGLRGLLEAHQRFGLINALRVPMGMLTFVGPLFVLPFSKSLVPIVGVLVAARVVAWGGHLFLCFRVAPELRHSVVWQRTSVAPLLRFGGWMTVSNVIGPLMVMVDRFAIGAFSSMTAVAYYVTPFEVVTKLWVVSTAITGVMFPAFSLSSGFSTERTSLLYKRAMKFTLAVLAPGAGVLFVGAKWGLTIWLGSSFAANSYEAARILTVGAFILGMEALPFALIQGYGRPDLPAKINLFEFPVYAICLYWAVGHFGALGAAIVWTIRAALDASVLMWLAHRLQRVSRTGELGILASEKAGSETVCV